MAFRPAGNINVTPPSGTRSGDLIVCTIEGEVMPDSPKPNGTTVTHADVRAIAQAHLTQWPGTEGALLDYVDQQENAEREHADYRAVAEHKTSIAVDDYLSLEEALKYMRMQRDVFCEKLNEYIDKTKEAEKRAETAEQENERLRAELRDAVGRCSEARQEGYERGKANARICEGCGCTLTCDC